MKGNWCKYCNEFVEIKKDYTRAKISCIIYLVAIGIGLLIFFPWGGLIVLIVPIFCTEGYILEIFTGRRACILCQKTTRRKRIRK